MMIFVGLGNSESKYLSTKHNVGFWMIDKFAESHDMGFKPGKGNEVSPEFCSAQVGVSKELNGCFTHKLFRKELARVFTEPAFEVTVGIVPLGGHGSAQKIDTDTIHVEVNFGVSHS